MAQIPITADVAAVVGKFGECVENRSLLLDKFVFHKSWSEKCSDQGEQIKWDEASRWSLMRIADQSQSLLNKDAAGKEHQSNGRNVEPDKKNRLRREAQVARALANVRWEDTGMAELRAKHSRRLIKLLAAARPKQHVVVIGQLEGRLAINLSESLIQNAGISLDRLFGAPLIPGSAIKGVCRHAALAELKNATTEQEQRELLHLFQQVFGTSEADFKGSGSLVTFARLLDNPERQTVKGSIDFMSASPTNTAHITVDLTTVHYPAYYQTGDASKQKEERPRPNPFPVVEQGARFAFCLVANRLADEPGKLLAAARRWLETALTQSGLGAKTTSGYGWFSLPSDGLQQLEEEERKERELQQEADRLQREQEEAAARKRQAQEAEAQRIQEKRSEKERVAALPPAERADEEVANWNDDAFRSRLKNFTKSKGGPSDDLKQAMVRALHTSRQSLWLELKAAATKGEPAKIVDAIRVLNKTMKLGKLP